MSFASRPMVALAERIRRDRLTAVHGRGVPIANSAKPMRLLNFPQVLI
jgi:hypothetical protein